MITIKQAQGLMNDDWDLVDLQLLIVDEAASGHGHANFIWWGEDYDQISISELCDILLAAGYAVSYSENKIDDDTINYHVTIYWGKGE